MTKPLQKVPYYVIDPGTDNLVDKALSISDFSKLMVSSYGRLAISWGLYEQEIASIIGPALKTKIDSEIIKQYGRMCKLMGIPDIKSKLYK